MQGTTIADTSRLDFKELGSSLTFLRPRLAVPALPRPVGTCERVRSGTRTLAAGTKIAPPFWVEVLGSADMDLFVLLQKLDAYGTPLQQFTTPDQSTVTHDITEWRVHPALPGI